MKNKIFNSIKIIIFSISIISVKTPSQIGLYQPNIPKQLKSRKK